MKLLFGLDLGLKDHSQCPQDFDLFYAHVWFLRTFKETYYMFYNRYVNFCKKLGSMFLSPMAMIRQLVWLSRHLFLLDSSKI